MKAPTPKPTGQTPRSSFLALVSGPTHHYQGWMMVEIYDAGIWICHEGDTVWYSLDWWELAHFAHATPPKLRDELEEMREAARQAGIVEAAADFARNPELWMQTQRKPPARN